MLYPHIDPVIFSLGPVSLRWYGVMYIIAFGLAWWLAGRRARQPDSGWTSEQVSDVIFYGALGVILGGRLGYVLFYKFSEFLADPRIIYQVWQGGMSFHGGLIGVFLALVLFAWRYKKSWLTVTDFVVPIVPLGLGVGRIGNFINNELWGKPTDLPWGMMQAPGGIAYHPSQLYEATLEGLVLFIIVWLYSARPRPSGAVSGLFLLGYGVFRFLVEFVRMPDADKGYLAFDWVTMGQVLSLPMIMIGLALIAYAYNNKKEQLST